MKKIILLILLFTFSTRSYAGDYMPVGSVLSEESYVFDLKEANALMNRMSELELELNKQKNLVEQYKLLDQIQQNKELGFESLLETKELQITEYKSLHEIDYKRIQQLNKQVNSNKVEKWLFLTAGIGLTVGSILIADKIDDGIESIGNQQQPLFRF